MNERSTRRIKSIRQKKDDPPVRPQLYISVMILMGMLVLAYMHQWDWVLALFIGLLVGNGLSALRGR
jgi:hypothetical protein